MAFWCCCNASFCDNVNECANIRFQDNFATGLAAGYTTTTCPGGTGTLFSASGGFATDTFGSGSTPKYLGDSGTLTQAITVPALNGLCISVAATIYAITGKVGGTTGVTIASVASMVGRFGSPTPAATQYLTNDNTNANGCSTGAAHTYGSANTNFVDGDCLCLVITDVSSGGGTYDIKSYVNGVLKDTRASVAKTLTAGGTINIGLIVSNGGKWGPLRIATS